MRFHINFFAILFFSVYSLLCEISFAQEKPQCKLREFQFRAVELNAADWIHWGDQPSQFSNWVTHSNRLIPVYTWGISLGSVKDKNSPYRKKNQIKKIYGSVPEGTLNRKANYFDQTQIYELQKQAWKSGKKNIILLVFDGMDWQNTQAASIYRNKKVLYEQGRGTGLAFLDYEKANSDFGYCVTSPYSTASKYDVDAQAVTEPQGFSGGYSAKFGGEEPWSEPGDPSYLLGKRKTLKNPYTDSAASATSLNTGKKTYNAAINVGTEGERMTTLAHEMQKSGVAIGVVTSVPISHATPACVYAHNVHRNDYQDITRDLLGLKSASHRDTALEGVDVLIGCGWGAEKDDERDKQGRNYVPGNKYLAMFDLKKIDVANGGEYTVVMRTPGAKGSEVLAKAAGKAVEDSTRLFGFFGTSQGHLPYQTADGMFDPTRGMSRAESYKPEDISENPTLAQMTKAALKVLQHKEKGFYLMVEAGDVDWANHNNNVDNSIGAVFSGEAAFVEITKWVKENSSWDETSLIVTSDHGHMMVLDDPKVLTGERPPESDEVFEKKLKAKRAKDEMKRKEEEKKKAAQAAKKKAAEEAKKEREKKKSTSGSK